jgi:hypothetical protein
LAAQNEGRREQASVAQASRPQGRTGKKGQFIHFFSSLFLYIYLFSKTILKMGFKSKSKEIKTTTHNKSNATT